MQRLSAARRLRAGAVDRQVALAGFSLACDRIGVRGGVRAGAAPRDPSRCTRRSSARDPAAARGPRRPHPRRRTRQMDRAATASRARPPTAGCCAERGEEGRSGEWHVVVTGPAMTLEHGDKSSACDRIGDEYGCQSTPGGRTLPESAVVRVVVADRAPTTWFARPTPRSPGSARCCFRMPRDRARQPAPSSASRPSAASAARGSRCGGVVDATAGQRRGARRDLGAHPVPRRRRSGRWPSLAKPRPRICRSGICTRAAVTSPGELLRRGHARAGVGARRRAVPRQRVRARPAAQRRVTRRPRGATRPTSRRRRWRAPSRTC